MHPATHFLVSWSVAESMRLGPRDRALVVLCGVLPDLDGLGIVAALAVRRFASVGLGLVAFHLHLLGDLVGSRGPDGYQWPIPYLMPFSRNWQLTWGGQWVLNAWPNVLLTAALIGSTLYLAWKRGYSPVGMISTRADGAVVSALRARFGEPFTV
jgi:hypothetical protein